MTEEENAAAYRAKLAKGRAYTAARLLALQGDPAALAALNARWAPFIEELRGTEPPGPVRFLEDEKCPPSGPPRILKYT
jgi:hypothetical protein